MEDGSSIRLPEPFNQDASFRKEGASPLHFYLNTEKTASGNKNNMSITNIIEHKGNCVFEVKGIIKSSLTSKDVQFESILESAQRVDLSQLPRAEILAGPTRPDGKPTIDIKNVSEKCRIHTKVVLNWKTDKETTKEIICQTVNTSASQDRLKRAISYMMQSFCKVDAF